jgi:tetratricopeptide (TPR) repeat protein
MPSKYEPETRAEVVRLVLDHRGDYPSEWAAIMAVSNRLGIGTVCASSGGLVAAPCTVFMFAVERCGQMDSLEYDVFLSYARADDVDGWVSGLRDAVYDDFREFSSEPFRIFFDTTEIRGRQDWELRLRQGLRSSRVLLVCLSPSYLRSVYCRWEWEEFARLQARRIGGGDPVTGVYFVELGGDADYEAQVVLWRHEVERVQLQQLQRWFPVGVQALQDAEVRRRVKALGQGVHGQVQQARRARQAPGNLRRHNPSFVGRAAELRALRHQLTGGAVGVVTAVHGIGGMGKTELAVTYAHAYAHTYQGGTWQVDADGATDVLEAISALALSPELGLEVREEHLQDRRWLGRRVLARLGELTEAARARDAGSAACLVLLDNVSEPELLAESQLAVLPDQPWFHLAVTTRLGVGDLGAAGTRGSVAMIEVGRLAVEDAVALIREHQPARDAARLRTDFSSPAEQDAARQVVELLDGYTLAVEQAAVYLGSSGVQPSQLLAVLRAHGTTVLDDVGGSAPAGAMLHKEKIAGVIVDQTLARLPPRATAALALACLLPPDTIPWSWLEELTDTPGDLAGPPRVGLPGLSVDGDWASTRRVLEGRRLLTLADDSRFARLHRVLGEHLRTRLADPETHDRLDTHLQQVSQELADAATPDTALLAVTAATITGRLTDGRHDLADPGHRLVDSVQQRLDLTTALGLAAATLTAYQHRAVADPDNPGHQRDLALSLNNVGAVLGARGDSHGAFEHYTRALQIDERLAADPDNPALRHALAVSLGRVGDVLAARGDTHTALDHYTRALHIDERLAAADPENTGHQRDVSVSLNRVGDVLVARGDTAGALEHYTRALQLRERLAAADPDNTRCQRDVSVSLGRVGNMLVARGDTDTGLEHYTRALHLVERLAAADPENTEYQRGVAGSLQRVGDVLADAGDIDGALEHYTRALHLVERLAAADPENTEYQRGVAGSLQRVGDVLGVRGDTAGALEHYTRSLHLVERLAAADPEDTGHQGDVSVSLGRVGDMLVARGDTDTALEHYTRALHIRERLAAAGPKSTRYQRDVWVSHYKIASALESVGDPSAADHWDKAHYLLAALDAAGKLPAADRATYDEVTRKLGPN